MALSISCPQCKKVIDLSPTTLGKRIKCPACGRSFVADEDPELTPHPPAPEAATPRPPRAAAPAPKQRLLRILVLFLGIVGATGSALLGWQLLEKLRANSATWAMEIQLARVMSLDVAGEIQGLHNRELTAYLHMAAAGLAAIGAVLAPRGRGVIPALCLLAAFAAPLAVNPKTYFFTGPLLFAGIISLLLGPGVPGR
jgi:hypothetical protein